MTYSGLIRRLVRHWRRSWLENFALVFSFSQTHLYRFLVHSLFQSAVTSSARPLWAPLLRDSMSGPGSVKTSCQISLHTSLVPFRTGRIHPQLTSVSGLAVGSSVVMHPPSYATLTPAECASHSFA